MFRLGYRANASRATAWISVVLVLSAPAAADWLITLDGKLIETQGPWTVEGDVLTYTDLEGEQHVLEIGDVDLEASEETTALRAGKPYVPREQAERAPKPPAGRKAKRQARKAAEPKIILYMTSLCKECSRARKLLEELGVDFVEKDVQKSKVAAKEYKKKAGHGGGLPVIDIGGALVFSNNPRVIRQRVEELEEREAAAKAREDP